ncbi:MULTISPECIES: YbaB/EbfC family nucleoid-associated protein [Actinokineospora]|uniref:YbaB/EbfC DNA-binding family protein n=1 Tax=Actinokineospora fastidiosa TaxID=1816 RepID=A0A918GAA2_9PSEU|nr:MULTISPECIES: YbaB/EbfC family nucleoid-associated protein [Actinokineospora]UVS81769.1 hypothetical protein Actkin_05533 [Actinokineospora sp. UTMC 2448]GGS25433.1 hypothetical protein GCM10010171_18440 [Actinokineospora fastidiosa]
MSSPESMLAGFQAQIEAKLRQADELRAVTERLRVTETSADSSVTVVVDATGNVADLRLTHAALDKAPDEVAASILTVLRTAQAKVGDRVRESVAPLIGGDSETMGMLMAGYDDRFGRAEPQTPPARPRDDDDFDQRDSWLD